ncbi:MAG: hypothetical protein Q9N34_07245 [Aquificota bacterium]|nr:hypothetical protein [Aquificota bacterium]
MCKRGIQRRRGKKAGDKDTVEGEKASVLPQRGNILKHISEWKGEHDPEPVQIRELSVRTSAQTVYENVSPKGENNNRNYPSGHTNPPEKAEYGVRPLLEAESKGETPSCQSRSSGRGT